MKWVYTPDTSTKNCISYHEHEATYVSGTYFPRKQPLGPSWRQSRLRVHAVAAVNRVVAWQPFLIPADSAARKHLAAPPATLQNLQQPNPRCFACQSEGREFKSSPSRFVMSTEVFSFAFSTAENQRFDHFIEFWLHSWHFYWNFPLFAVHNCDADF